MPTKDQYEFFKLQFSEEDFRNTHLTKRAEIYLSLISLFLTGFIFKLNDFKIYIVRNQLVLVVFCSILLSLFAGATFIILSLQIKNYQAVMDVSKWPNELADEPLSDSEFYINRITDYIITTPKNQSINNKKGALLKLAGYSLLIAIVTIGIFIFLIAVYE